MDGDEIDVVGQFGMTHPDVGGLGGAHRQGGTPADAVEVLDEFRDGDIATQQHLIADHDPHHIAVTLGQDIAQTVPLLVILLRIRADPGPQRDIQPVLQGQARHLR